MRFNFLGLAVLAASICALCSCSDSNSAAVSSGTGILYVAAQANSSISSYSVNLSNGTLTQVGNSIATGTTPFAMAVTPGIDALFISDRGANNVSSYAINSDGSLTAGSGTTATGKTPMGMAVDPAGKFLLVANQGTFQDPKSGTISVYSISGSSLKQVAGSPFPTESQGDLTGSGPVAVVVSASGKYVYAANQFSNTVAAFSLNSSSGALTPLGASPYNVDLSPSAIAIAPNGGALLVANSGSNDISAFLVCDTLVVSCADVNSPDGSLTAASGSPFPAGGGPASIAFDPSFAFVYVADKASNQISQYSYGANTGVLSPLSPPTISTGATPVSVTVGSGTTGTNVGNTTTNPTDYVYVANNGASTVSIFNLNTTTGLLDVVGTPVDTFGNPSAVVVK